MDLCGPMRIMHSHPEGPERLDSKFGTTADLATSCNLQDPRTLVLATRRGGSLEDEHAESWTIAHGAKRDLSARRHDHLRHILPHSDYIDQPRRPCIGWYCGHLKICYLDQGTNGHSRAIANASQTSRRSSQILRRSSDSHL